MHIADDTVMLRSVLYWLGSACSLVPLSLFASYNMCFIFPLRSTKMPKMSINYRNNSLLSLLFAAMLFFTFPTRSAGGPGSSKREEICGQENHFEILVSCSVYTVVYDGWFEGRSQGTFLK